MTLLRIVVNCRQLLSDLYFRYIRYFLCFSLIELSSSFVIHGRDEPGFLLEGSLMGGVGQCIVVSCRTVFLQFVRSSVTSLESGGGGGYREVGHLSDPHQPDSGVRREHCVAAISIVLLV